MLRYSFALKEMYIFMVKFLLLFEIHPPDFNLMITDPFLSNEVPHATSFEPRNHNIKLALLQFPNHERLRDTLLKSKMYIRFKSFTKNIHKRANLRGISK